MQIQAYQRLSILHNTDLFGSVSCIVWMTSKTHLKQINFARVCKHPHALDLHMGGLIEWSPSWILPENCITPSQLSVDCKSVHFSLYTIPNFHPKNQDVCRGSQRKVRKWASSTRLVYRSSQIFFVSHYDPYWTSDFYRSVWICIQN